MISLFGISGKFLRTLILGTAFMCVSFSLLAQSPRVPKNKLLNNLKGKRDSVIQKTKEGAPGNLQPQDKFTSRLSALDTLPNDSSLTFRARKIFHNADTVGATDKVFPSSSLSTDSISGKLAKLKPAFLRSLSDSIAAPATGKVVPDSLLRSLDVNSFISSRTDSISDRIKLPDSLSNKLKPLAVPSAISGVGGESGQSISPLPRNVTSAMPDLKIPETTANIPEVSLDTDQIGNATNKLSEHTSTASSGLSKIKIPDASLPDPDITQIRQVEPYSAKLNAALEKKDVINNINGQDLGSVSEKAEGKASEMLPVGDLPALPQATRFNDPMVAKELLLNYKKEFNVNHFAGHEEQILNAMEKFSSLKTKYANREGVIDLLRDKQEEVPHLKFIDRVRVGVLFQVQKPEVLWFDFNPYVGVKLHRFVPAAGWNYRLAYASDRGIVSEQRIYGPRVSLEYEWLRMLSPIAVIEVMNAPADRNIVNQEIKRVWSWSYMAGAKTSVGMGRNLRLTTQMLYSFVNRVRTPYSNRFNIRLGLEYHFVRRTFSRQKSVANADADVRQ